MSKIHDITMPSHIKQCTNTFLEHFQNSDHDTQQVAKSSVRDVVNPGIKPVFYIEKNIMITNNSLNQLQNKTIILKDDVKFKDIKVNDSIS